MNVQIYFFFQNKDIKLECTKAHVDLECLVQTF